MMLIWFLFSFKDGAGQATQRKIIVYLNDKSSSIDIMQQYHDKMAESHIQDKNNRIFEFAVPRRLLLIGCLAIALNFFLDQQQLILTVLLIRYDIAKFLLSVILICFVIFFTTSECS